MPTLADIRAKYPQYEDMSDEQIAQGMHRKFYADMPFDDFAKRINYAPVNAPGAQESNGVSKFDIASAFSPVTLPLAISKAFVDNPTVRRTAGDIGQRVRGSLIEGLGGTMEGVERMLDPVTRPLEAISNATNTPNLSGKHAELAAIYGVAPDAFAKMDEPAKGRLFDSLPEDKQQAISDIVSGGIGAAFANELTADFDPSDVSTNLRGAGEYVKNDISPEGALAVKNSQVSGSLLDPENISFGKDPSVMGFALQGSDVMGQMAPAAMAAYLTRGRSLAAQTGTAGTITAAQTGGFAAGEEHRRIMEMPIDELLEVPEFAKMIDDGAEAGKARAHLAEMAASGAFKYAAPVGALSGVLLGGIANKTGQSIISRVFGGSKPARFLGGTFVEGGGEGVEEVFEGVAQRGGAAQATGETRDLMEGSAAEFTLGTLAGPMGGGGAMIGPDPNASPTNPATSVGRAGAGVNAGDVLGDVGEDTGPIKTEGVPMTAGAGVTIDEDGNVLEERSGLALPPPGPPPPGTDIGPAGPLQAETPPDWMVDSEETASAPGDWQAREQAKRQRAGGPGMGPVVDGVPTMAPDEMAQAAFDTAMETATSAMGRAPSKSSVNALAAKVAERFGVDPAALVKRSRNLVRVPAPIASVAPAPVAVTQPAAAQPVVAPELPRGRMFRRGRDAEAVELPGGAWLTRRRVAGHWQPWQRRRSFDPSGAHGYVPYQSQSGSVRTPVGTIRVGEDRREAAQTGPKAPNDIIDTIIAAGGISREAARMAGIDPSMLTTRRGATRWLFPRNNGMSLNGLRELLTTEGFFHQDDPDALPTVSDDDAFEIFNRALQGERIVSPNRAAEEAAYQASLLESNEEAAPPVVEPVVDDPRTDEDEQIAAEFLSRIEADPIARRVFDDFDADEDMDALGIVELTEVAERLGATPSEIRQAYNAQGDADLARNLWELIHNKEIANGPVARERQAGDRDGAPTQPGGAEAARDAARRTRPAGDEGAGAARSGEPVGQAALEQAAELERLRARVAELESVRGANEVTGLPGKAAFEADESLGWSTVAAIDMDGLGRLNDATSHEAANAVMIAMADAMRAAQVDGVRFYHLHGDELAARFQNPDDAASITLALQDALAAMSVRINVTLENGTVRAYSYDGIGITFGLGANYGTADAAAIRSKHEREAAGLRQNKNQPGPPRQLRDLAGIPQRRNDDDPGRQRAGGDVQGEPAALTLTDDTVVTPPVAERPASQASLFAPVTDIDRERLRFERDRPRPPVTDTVDIEEAINQTPPSGGVSVSGGDTNPAASAATTEEYRNGSVEEAVEPQDVFREEGPQSAEDVERRKEAEEAGARREAAAELGQAAAGHDEAGILATGRDDESADGEADQPSAVGDAGVGLRGQAGASRGATGRSRSPAGPVTENAIATEGDLVTLQHGDATVRVRRADWEGDRPKLRTYTKQGKPSQGFADRANLAEVASSKIEDFGEKIGGARKDVWSSFKDQLREVSDDNVLTEPLSKTWPQPDYQKMLDEGADSWVVAFVRSARDEIPRKPSKSWKQLAWAEKVKMLRDLANELLNNPKTVDLAKRKIKELNTRGMREMMSRIELYQLVGHAQSLAGVSFAEHHYSLYKGRENVRMWVVEKATAATAFSNWPRELATGDTKEQMLQAFKEKVASLQLSPEKAKVAAFDIYSYRGVVGYLIGKKVGRNHIDLAGPFPTVGEARAYRDANNAALVAKLEASKEIPNERRDTNEPRVGEDMRNGQDVTPQMFGDAFGFKGVEFGNWVEQTKRQNDLNEAFDALMDMAAILGIPPKAISLNGELGIAFGARGSGGVKPAAAHYEPGKVVINLTKKNGAGSLGHEWWHALDNYFQRSRGKSEYATEALDVSLASRGSRFVEDAKMRKAMVESFGAVVSAIKNTALKARSAKLDAKRTKEYWTTGREMAARAFESYLITKLQDQNASNDYLANIVDEDTWSAMEKLGFELDGSYPYPTAGEVPIISAAFGKFFDTIESREGADGKVELFSNPAPGWESAAGDQLSQAAVDREVSKAQADFDGVTIEVMDSIQDAPTSDRTKRLYPGANGLTDGKSRVWIFRHGLQSLQALRMTLAHEIIGHIGVERVIGADWPAVVDAIKRIRAGSKFASPAVVNAVKDAETRYPKADDLTFAREAVAIMAENGVTGSLMDRIVAAVRKYLRRVFGSLQWSDAEIRNLLRRAGEAARKPAVFRGAEFEAAQVVFHGTPHKVDRFRMDKIGTGEGAQAYGWGAYFASRRGVADFYRDALTDAIVKFASEEAKNKFLSGDADRAIAFARGRIKDGGSIASVIEETRQGARNWRDRKPTSYRREGPDLAMAAAFDAVADALESGDLVIEKEKGNLYTVDVPEDTDLLDWDKPLSEQPEKVREAILSSDVMGRESPGWKGAPADMAERTIGSRAGKEIYLDLVARFGTDGNAQMRASEHLASLGIPGLRYLDGTSRSNDEGSHNYVIWSEEAIGEPSDGMASNPDGAITDTPEFKAWFGDSKVVDADGKPLVVYHGTRHDVDSFRREGRRGQDRMHYFAADPGVASEYGGQIQYGSPNVMPVYLSLQKAYEFDADGAQWGSLPITLFPDEIRNLFDDRNILRGREGSTPQIGFTDVNRAAQIAGYDGVIARNIIDGAGTYGDKTPTTVYVAFRPEQIKSVNNRGTFDPNDPSILASNPAQGPIERKMSDDARSGQPIDKIFRLPFQMLGGLDSHGRLKVGSKLHDWLSRVLTEKTPTEDGPFGWMAPILKTVRSGLIDRYGVPQDFVQRDERRESEVRSVLMHAARVATDLEGLTTAEAKVLQAMLTGQEMPAGELGKLSQPIKEAIDQMGREAVEMGLISPEAYERNRGAYLHRSYLKYEADRTPLGKAIGRFLDKRRKKLLGDTLRRRGMTMERDTGALAAALGGSVRDGDTVTVLRQKTEAGGVRTKYQRGPLNGPAPVGWENLGDWRVMGFDGKKAKLWRDFTPAEREKMGEILDARYNITKTFALMAHDLATGRFLRDIAANPDWARADLPEGATAAEARGRYDTYADSDWVRVPDAAIPGTNDGKEYETVNKFGKIEKGVGRPVKRWGELAGMYVRAPIWRDLNQLREMQNPQLWGSAWQKVLTFWKTNKTARNPVVHVNNVMSNMMFMDLADIRLRDLYRGIGAWKRGEADEDYRNAMAHGAFAGGFADQELKRKVLQPILDDILAKQKVDGQDTAESRLGVLHLLSTIWDGIKKVDGKMLDAYNAEDEIFRLAFYLRRQSLGDTPEEAARAARRQFIDYDIRAPWVNMARNTVLPFIGYTYRAIPILAQAIAERPWKLAKYATMAAAANWLGYLFAPGDEDDERKVMAPAVQGNTWTGTPRMIRMPWYDADGNPVFLDVRRWIPAGDVFDMNQSEIGLPAWMQFGGPLQLAGELMLNKQAFTKQPIVDPLTDTTGEKAGKVASWAWKAMAPNAPWIPESYSWDKIGQAITGETDELGRDYSVVEATASVLGVKAAGMDVALQRRYRDREFDRVDRELDFDLSSLKRERGRNKISDERFKAAVAKIVEKKRRLAVERRRVLSRSASKPNG